MTRARRSNDRDGGPPLDPLREYSEDEATAIVNALCDTPEVDDAPARLRRAARRRYGISGLGAMVLSVTLLTVGFGSGSVTWHLAYTRVAVAEKTAALEQEYAERLEGVLVLTAEGASKSVKEGEWADAIKWMMFVDRFVKDGVMDEALRAKYATSLHGLQAHLDQLERNLDEAAEDDQRR